MPKGNRHFFKIDSVSGILVRVLRKISGLQFIEFQSSVCNRILGACKALAGKMWRFCSKSTGSIPEFNEKLPNLDAKFCVGGLGGKPVGAEKCEFL